MTVMRIAAPLGCELIQVSDAERGEQPLAVGLEARVPRGAGPRQVNGQVQARAAVGQDDHPVGEQPWPGTRGAPFQDDYS